VDQASRTARRESEIPLRRLIPVVLLAVACASPGMPPGGPPDVAAPEILSITPDSGTVGVKPKEVIFHFDEVVSERPTGATTLADLFMISPRDGVPSVSWHRDAITVKPAHGWRANTPYTVILLRGLADIRGNVRNTGATTFFSTGPVIPRTRISGRVFDWVAGTPAGGSLVETYVPPDTIHAYIALADSSGSFAVEHIPATRYTVRAYIDRNKNSSIDPSEPWDSVSVNLGDSVRTDLLIFVHDTVPPHIRDIAASDSVTLTVTFDKPVDPNQTLTARNFTIRASGPDSAVIPIASAGPAPVDTTRQAVTPAARPPAAQPGRPPARGRADTTTAIRAVMPRKAPSSTAIIVLSRPLTPKAAYRVRAIGIRGLLGYTGDSERVYTAPAPPAPPPAKPASVAPPTPPPVQQ
jgi:hypothetical protein